MKEKEILIKYFEYENREDLTAEDNIMLSYADEASSNAYAPYSHFKVGCAIKLDNNIIVKGNNQENIAYPSGLCAERVAMFNASANYPNIGIESIAVVAHSDDFLVDFPVTPCGSCRQVMSESEKRQQQKIRYILAGTKGKILIIEGIDNLLPFIFHPEKLARKV